jgi:hypothetical protein
MRFDLSAVQPLVPPRHLEASFRSAGVHRALAFRPDFAEALYNRGNALHELKRSQDGAVKRIRTKFGDAAIYPELCSV